MANITKGEGSTLAYSLTFGGTYTTIAQRVSISGPKMEVASVETTSLDSTSRSFRPAVIPDMGTVDMEVYFDPDDATHTAIKNLMATPSVKYWKLTLTDITASPDPVTAATTATFAGFPTSFELNGMELDSNLGASMSIKLTGAITWA